ncbi:AMP-binding protein [Mycobacteroides abscessus]
MSYREHVQRAMKWHFSPETGSEFWLEKAKSLDFDPISDVKTRRDLFKFPDVSSEWKDAPIEALTPANMSAFGIVPRIYESGGTTGAPKRIVDHSQWALSSAWAAKALQYVGAPRLGSMLYLGPSGPHVVGHAVAVMADELGLPLLRIDLDPRFVRTAISGGHGGVADAYIEHILRQARWALQSQRVTVLWATPPLLDAIALDSELAHLVRQSVRLIVWGSTSMDPDSLHILRTEVFPETVICGLYGNTMMGIAVELEPGSHKRPIFTPHFPFSAVSVIDTEDQSDVEYGARGAVAIHVLTPELLLPVSFERDEATRVKSPSHDAEGHDSVQDIQPLKIPGQQIIEGVY